MIIFSIIYILFLCCYFITRTSGNLKYRAINKYIMAFMYFGYAVYQFQSYELSSFHLVLMVALFFALLGDIFLVFDFERGGDFFLCGNVCFVVYYLGLFVNSGLDFGNFFGVLIAWIVLLGAFIFLSHKFPNVIKLGDFRAKMTFYLASIMLHGMFGLGAMILLNSTASFIMGLGSLMFLISDLILTIDKFVIRGKKWITRCNSFFYFVGLLLIVLSMGL